MRDMLLPLMRRVQAAAPRTTLVWASPPIRIPRTLPAVELPPEWYPLYVRVARDLGFFRPAGPLYHLDGFSLSMECLPWCFRADGAHLGPTANEVLMQQLANLYQVRRQADAAAAAAATSGGRAKQVARP